MADYFNTTPNFTNPSYATPEQLANQRAYADALTKRSGENVNRPAGAIANMISALTGNLERNRANEIQNQQAGQNASNISELISQLQHGQQIDPQTAGRVMANPFADATHRALIGALVKPEPVQSVYGQPGYQSPSQGVQAAPIQGNFQPGYRVEQGAAGVHTNAPFQSPMPAQRPPVASSPQVWGDKEAQAAGLYPSSPPAGVGGPAPSAALPTAPAPVAPNGAPAGPLGLDQLAAKGREYAAQSAFTQGTAEGQTTIARGDIDAAATAPTIKRVAGTMLDDLHAHGDKMTFGPTAEWSNTIKRGLANYTPGIMKDQLTALASADSFDKMSAQLTSLLAKGGGTDAQLFNNMKSVPGAHNSKEGAEALLKMTIQVADQQQALRQITGNAGNAQQYEQLRNQFYQQHPIINPITGNPIALDLQQNKAAGGAYEKTATNPQTGEKLGLRNGQWEPIK
jgi:hypothetical protein